MLGIPHFIVNLTMELTRELGNIDIGPYQSIMQLYLPIAIREGLYQVTPPPLKMLIFTNRSSGDPGRANKARLARLESTGRNGA